MLYKKGKYVTSKDHGIHLLNQRPCSLSAEGTPEVIKIQSPHHSTTKTQLLDNSALRWFKEYTKNSFSDTVLVYSSYLSNKICNNSNDSNNNNNNNDDDDDDDDDEQLSLGTTIFDKIVGTT